MDTVYWKIYDPCGNHVISTTRVPADNTADGREVMHALKREGYRVTRVTVRPRPVTPA